MSDIKQLNLRNLEALMGKRKLLLIMTLVIISLVVTGFVWAQKRVNIIADGKNISVRTIHNKPEDILAQANINLGDKDEYRLSTQSVVSDTTIEVYRAIPVVVKVNGKTEIITTGKPTVGELAASLGYTQENSRLSPSGDTRLSSMLEIEVVALTERMVTQQMPIEPPVVRQADSSMEKGFEETVDQGSEGQKEVSIKVSLENGNEVSRTVVGEKVVTPPKPQVVKVGTRDTVETSRGAMRFRTTHMMEATAYTPYDGAQTGITASGIAARRGIVAVDPSVIPLGSRVYIPGYGLALAADTGGDIVGDRIDLCMEGRGEAMSFGRKTVKVYVIAE
ncbi:MAG: hypothetical protein H6Q75_1477 [Firmicutes bacterium]|nr:hypothetical protein [Bacillota bacterium]